MNTVYRMRIVWIILFPLFQGCATILTLSIPVTETNRDTKNVVIDTDKIRAVGRLSNEDNYPGAIVVAGNKYTYLMTKGGEDLEQIAKALNPKYINHRTFYRQGLNPWEGVARLKMNGNQFSGGYSFEYDNENNGLTSAENTLISKLCKKQDGAWFGLKKFVFYKCNFSFSGLLYMALPQQIYKEKVFSKEYEIELYEYEQSENYGKEEISPKRVIDKLVALPIAVIFDVATSPLQLFMYFSQKK